MKCDYCKEENNPRDLVAIEVMPLLGRVFIHSQCLEKLRNRIREVVGLTVHPEEKKI